VGLCQDGLPVLLEELVKAASSSQAGTPDSGPSRIARSLRLYLSTEQLWRGLPGPGNNPPGFTRGHRGPGPDTCRYNSHGVRRSGVDSPSPPPPHREDLNRQPPRDRRGEGAESPRQQHRPPAPSAGSAAPPSCCAPGRRPRPCAVTVWPRPSSLARVGASPSRVTPR